MLCTRFLKLNGLYLDLGVCLFWTFSFHRWRLYWSNILTVAFLLLWLFKCNCYSNKNLLLILQIAKNIFGKSEFSIRIRQFVWFFSCLLVSFAVVSVYCECYSLLIGVTCYMSYMGVDKDQKASKFPASQSHRTKTTLKKHQNSKWPEQPQPWFFRYLLLLFEFGVFSLVVSYGCYGIFTFSYVTFLSIL